MDCQQAEKYIDDYLDSTLAPPLRQRLEIHLQGCRHCQSELNSSRQLLTTLQSTPVPAADGEQMHKLIQQAIATGKRYEQRQKVLRFAAMAAIVCLLLSAAFFTPLRPGSDSEQPQLTIALYEQKTVSLLVDSRQAIDNARITIALPSQLSLAGFPNQQSISWQTNLKTGKNLLKLPIVAEQLGQGTISTRIDHGTKSKVMELQALVAGPA